MSEPAANTLHGVLSAIAFAARAHHGQMRKDRRTPYASHAFRVCMVLRHAFSIADERVMSAAVLHDTIEDTTTDFDDLADHFGVEVAEWVRQLSKDKRLPFEQREANYCETLGKAPWQVQVCKLADVYDNLLDMAYLEPAGRPRALANKRRYLRAMETGVQPESRRALDLTLALWTELANGANE